MERCSHPTEAGGTCEQTVFITEDLETVRALLAEPGLALCHYHTLIVLERTQKPSDYLTPEELDATMGGRQHGDGRRLDQYALEGTAV